MSVNQEAAEFDIDIVELKLLLLNIKDELENLEFKIEKRCSDLLKLILTIKQFDDVAEIYKKITTEFHCLNDDIVNIRNNCKNVMQRYEEEKAIKLNSFVNADQKSEDTHYSVTRSTILKSKINFIDNKKLADNLNAMKFIVENFENENKKLREVNNRQLQQLHDIIHMSLGVPKGEEISKPKKRPKTVRIEKDVEKDESILEIKEIMYNIKEQLREKFKDFDNYESFSEELIVQDNINKSDDIILPQHEWAARVEMFRNIVNDMSLIEVKLIAVKALFIVKEAQI